MGVKLIIKGADFSANGMQGEIVEPLPAEFYNSFDRAEYIESQGGNNGAYIDTGYKYTSGDFRLEVKAEILEHKDDQFLCGAQSAQGARCFCVAYYNVSHGGCYFVEGDAAANNSNNKALLLGTTMEYDIDLASNGMTVSGTSAGAQVSKTFEGSVNTNLNLFVLAKNSSGSVGARAKAKLYKFKLTVNDVVVLNLIPCRRKSDGAYGVYNTVDGSFISSATSTAFTGQLKSN